MHINTTRTALLSAIIIATLSQAHAKDIRDELNIQTGKAQLVIRDLPPQQVAEKVKDALSQFAIPTNLNFKTIPTPLPARPGAPTEKSVLIQGSPATDYVCDGAYAELTKMPPPVQNAFYFNREALRSCMYAFQGGVRIDIIFHVIRKTESLTGGLFNSITKSIRGSDGERISGQLKENIEAIRKVLPTALVARIEAPGMAVEEPDKDAVAQIIPPPTPAELAAAQAKPEQAAPVQASAPAKPAAQRHMDGGVDLSLIGARKELTAMGFKFFDQDQFVDAARRNDFLTVRLFLAAAAIRPGSPDSKGDTALSFAKDNTEMKFFLNAFIEAEKQGDYPGKIGEAVLSR
ncbi:hypothetical protein [Janthinobacterium aquaticum]|uniref:hypothetical protein n=1 Tax=Janthinobacterium sp. FT58W TaxID=2654254 RepID=UPI001263FAAE|nr:hypothetical protein [Janthinobacterium sp. FT58W]KAB8042691.1 hypothetical protein GCM43_11490 [Janthinobacterium sp. FT58W]